MTLTGPGGIGKTRFALQVAGEIAGEFSGGVCFVPLSSVGEHGLVATAIAQALGAREVANQSAQESLKEYLGGLNQPLMLWLDNFEHLTPAASVIAQLLTIGPQLKVVVTSQAPLHVYGEQEFPVPPLALPDPKSLPPLEALSRLPAVALFVERARAVKPEFALTKENAPTVAAICARLDGLPLAIELAAARLKLLSPPSMLTRLESRLNLLTGGARDLPSRQQTLRSTVDWSYGLLNPEEHVTVEGDLDLQGTRGLSKEVPVGFQNIRVVFDVRAPEATKEQLSALQAKTEQYCVVMQTLQHPPKIEHSWA